MEHHGTFATTFLLCFAHILEAAVISTFYDMENQWKSWKHRRYDIRLPGSESMAEIETVWHIDIVDPTKASPNVVACGPCGDVTLGETNDLWPRNQGTTRYNKVLTAWDLAIHCCCQSKSKWSGRMRTWLHVCSMLDSLDAVSMKE